MKRVLVIALLVLAGSASQASAQVIGVNCFAPTLVTCHGIWHQSPVTVEWTLPAGWVATSGCLNQTVTEDTTGITQGCNADLPEGGDAIGRAITLKIDKTPPVVTAASASRGPDVNGWYRSPLQVTFSGADATSGLEGCTSATYAGPDSGSAAVTGTCTDRAGNVSPASAFGLRYDATPPTVARLKASPGDHVVKIRWDVNGAAAVQLWRSPGRRGQPQSIISHGIEGRISDRRVRNGRRYEYRLLAYDEAGNSTTRTFSATPEPRLIAPRPGARVERPPVLRWTAVRDAGYYNVQLFRGDRKILSAWPERPRFALERSWEFEGVRFRLKPGRRYRWLVWPGRGERSLNDYGPLIGSAGFTFAP